MAAQPGTRRVDAHPLDVGQLEVEPVALRHFRRLAPRLRLLDVGERREEPALEHARAVLGRLDRWIPAAEGLRDRLDPAEPAVRRLVPDPDPRQPVGMVGLEVELREVHRGVSHVAHVGWVADHAALVEELGGRAVLVVDREGEVVGGGEHVEHVAQTGGVERVRVAGRCRDRDQLVERPHPNPHRDVAEGRHHRPGGRAGPESGRADGRLASREQVRELGAELVGARSRPSSSRRSRSGAGRADTGGRRRPRPRTRRRRPGRSTSRRARARTR